MITLFQWAAGICWCLFSILASVHGSHRAPQGQACLWLEGAEGYRTACGLHGSYLGTDSSSLPHILVSVSAGRFDDRDQRDVGPKMPPPFDIVRRWRHRAIKPHEGGGMLFLKRLSHPSVSGALRWCVMCAAIISA